MNELLIILLIMISMGFVLFCIISVNPIYSLINMIGVVLMVGMMFLILGLDYIAFMFLIIYVGAIAILFLFIIMMVNLRNETIKYSYTRYMGISLLVASSLFYFLKFSSKFVELRSVEKEKFIYIEWEAKVTDFHNIDAVNILLFDRYWEIFLLLGILLFVVMIGVIYITIRITDETIKKQNLENQDLKNFLKLRKIK